MPWRCCVPGCKSNYGATQDFSTFRFPRNAELREKWIRSIHREDFTPSNSSVVCSRHFVEDQILMHDTFPIVDGSPIILPRKLPKLKDGAVPSVFPDQPRYFTVPVAKERDGVQRRENVLAKRDEEVLQDFLESDSINSYEDFLSDYKAKLDQFNCKVNKLWLVSVGNDNICFFKFSHDGNNIPKCMISFKIFNDFTVSVYYKDLPITMSRFSSYLTNDYKCNKWTMFDNLLSHLYNFEETFETPDDQMIKNLFDKLDEAMEIRLGDNYDKYLKLKEQVLLLGANRKRYTPDLMLLACTLFYYSPSAYQFLRDNTFLTLPSSSYIRKLCFSSDMNCPGLNDQHLNYLKERLASLSEKEKLVILMLDEIHIKSNLQYKGGKIFGASDNTSGLAKCIQTFMISSVMSSHKDVVALFPVRNLTASDLHKYTCTVLESLHSIGYTVLALISDNNRVNRNMFEKMCDGELSASIIHPFDPNLKLFFLFDSVHLFKCIRNNWLSEKTQTFIIPSFDDFNSPLFAAFKTIKDLYISESNKCVKLAPGLSQKVLFPSSFERQNVQLVVNLFNDKTIAAIKSTTPEENGVLEFLTIIVKWWNVVNVKNIFKGKIKLLPEAEPITTTHSPNILFLKHFESWLENWEQFKFCFDNTDLTLPPRAFKLSKETFFALHHTTRAFVELSEYLFNELNFKYILLGKFQTDNLEQRFGLYRRMSGCNYNVSVTQVMESEKKLKVMNSLKIKGKQSEFKLVKLFQSECDDSQFELTASSSVEQFYDVLDNLNDIYVIENDSSVLTYVSGYVAHAVRKKVHCEYCSLRLSLDKDLNVEVSQHSSEYLFLLDRGGLKWPTEFVLNLCTNTYLIFQNLINLHEQQFCRISNQKNTLVNLSLFYNSTTYDNEVCHCRRELSNVVSLCIKVMSNILLNNYTKLVNNNISTEKHNKRKLSTLC